MLPTGTEVSQTRVPGGQQPVLELNMHDIAPIPEEDFMPPIGSLSYRVLFYYTAYRTSVEDYWKNEGKFWAKNEDKFIGPGSVVTAAVKDLVLPTDTPDQKLRKLYAAVMKLENTRYTRQHSAAEEKAQGFKEVHNTDDIWTRKRGTDDQLTGLFVAMARAAGFKAYVGIVTNRDRNLFIKNYLSLSQLDDVGRHRQRRWKRSVLRSRLPLLSLWTSQPGSTPTPRAFARPNAGSDFFDTPGEPYTFSRTQRVANLTIDQQGAVSGTITMTYTGDPAIALAAARTSKETLPASSARSAPASKRLVPPGLELKVTSIDKVEDYEQPLVANLEVKGTLGSSTGKRVLLPGDIFEANAQARLPPREARNPRLLPISPHACRTQFASSFQQIVLRRVAPRTPKRPASRNLSPTPCQPSPHPPASPSAATTLGERSSIFRRQYSGSPRLLLQDGNQGPGTRRPHHRLRQTNANRELTRSTQARLL